MSEPRILTRSDMKTLGLSSLGGALEFYDFIIFVFFTKIISAVFFNPETAPWLATLQTYSIFASGYLARPIGGIIMAHLGDKFGRKKVFTFSILLMAFSTLCMALVPSYASIGVAAPILLALFRILQGIAIGGEIPGAWTFVSEHVPSRYVGFATGFLTSGLSLGILLGSLVATLVNHLFSPQFIMDYGWRGAFILGGIFGLLAVWLRQWLDETPIFKQMQKARSLTKEVPLKIVLKSHGESVLIAVLLTWALSATIVISTLMTPNFMENPPYGYSGNTALAANCVTSLFLIIATPIAGILCDRIGSGRFFLGGGICFAITAYVFYNYAGTSTLSLFVLSAFLGFFAGYVGAVAYVMVKAFPAAVRFTGLAFSYNMSYAILGGTIPVVISLINSLTPMGHVWYLLAIGMLASGLGIYLLCRGEARQFDIGVEEKPK
ncbi:MFS transporter [Bartonella sp. HY329]|uniref:MFS transporter n=1 Tax=unclassified Bartonella TaxID=2645622 RepID=UPI0021C80093|nr:MULTISPECIES: MFS transporter [unclassified Bartonella]UXM95595.1 MFS transporter [Bartonella sp. HY329]UXN09920.1 MFS transporter [Bartonella sp. HY328]